MLNEVKSAVAPSGGGSKIVTVEARKIMDSRGQPTVEVKIETDDGLLATDSVPSGTSTGAAEAALVEPQIAVDNVNQILAPKLKGMDVGKQQAIDRKMIEIDGTPNKAKLGANAILGVSLAVSRVGSLAAKMPLYWHLNKLFAKISGAAIEPAMSVPMMVMICGGKHGGNNLCIQEFLTIGEVEDGIKLWQTLEKILKERKIGYNLGLEGAFSADLKYDEEAIELIIEAIAVGGLKDKIRLGLDIAGNNCQMSSEQILSLVKKYDLYSLEDPFGEKDWEKFGQLKLELKEIKDDFILIGDDLFATHKTLLQKGINQLVANGIIIKVNQVGTVTETLEVVALAKKANFSVIVSHRSGETTDTFIADLAVAVAADFLKAGAPIPKERLLKYKRLKEIDSEL